MALKKVRFESVYSVFVYVLSLASHYHEFKNPTQFVLIFSLENMSNRNRKIKKGNKIFLKNKTRISGFYCVFAFFLKLET